MELTFFETDDKQFHHLPTLGHISTITYARLFMADYVDWDRFIYLDTDLIVQHDLSELYGLSFDGAALFAKPEHRGHFNAGVIPGQRSAMAG